MRAGNACPIAGFFMRGRMGGMRFRKLRIVWSVVCGIACVLLVELWVRSYWLRDTVNCPMPGGLVASSICGRISVAHFLDRLEDSRWERNWDWKSFQVKSIAPELLAAPSWHYDSSRFGTYVSFPIWFAVILVGAFAVLPWIHWSRRFTLRTLLIATEALPEN
jgi:hypothetical protein